VIPGKWLQKVASRIHDCLERGSNVGFRFGLTEQPTDYTPVLLKSKLNVQGISLKDRG